MEKYGYVFISTNLINNKKYIGRHKAKSFTNKYKGSGKLIREAFKKYGINNFSVELIEWCDSEDSLNERERYWISKYNATEDPNFYNLSNGGEGFGGLSGDKNPAKRPDVRKKMSENHADFSGKNNPNYGGLSEINKRHISESRIAKGTAKGKNNPMYGRRGKDSPHYNRVHINNGDISRTCHKDELEYYLNNGWRRGRIIRNSRKNKVLESATTIENTSLEKS